MKTIFLREQKIYSIYSFIGFYFDLYFVIRFLCVEFV